MSVVYASHAQNQPGGPPGLAEFGLSMTWTGWDGSVWNLSDRAVSGLSLGPGTRGLGMPSGTRFASETPAVHGSRFRSSRIMSREVLWPLSVLRDDSATWVERDSAFWATMRPDRPGSWAVTTPNGTTRTLTCRWDPEQNRDDGFAVDPALRGWATYGVYLVADDDPFWSGAPVVRSFSSGAPVDFFDPGGSPPFHISAGNLLAAATMDNPGDVEAHPIWRIDGPVTDVTLGVDGRTIEVPITVADGEHLIVDSRPAHQTAVRDDGTDVTASLGAVDFAPVPPGAVVPLTLSMTGTGTVTTTLTPRFYRAW